MSQKTTAQLSAELLTAITDNTAGENTAARVRTLVQNLIDSVWNKSDAQFSQPGEITAEVVQIDPPPFGPPLYMCTPDASLGKSFFIDVNQVGGILLEVPTSAKAGEIYNFFFLQSADTGTVTLRSGFLNQTRFNMVTGDGNVSMFQAYAHYNSRTQSVDLYCYPQQDFS